MPGLRHTPVMVEEVLAALRLQSGATVIDATLGLGGHAAAMLASIGPSGKLLGLERSENGLREASKRLEQSSAQLTLVHADFRDLGRVARAYDVTAVDAILFDLGLASWQIDTGYRGLSFQQSGRLDMRLTPKRPGDFTTKADDPSQWISLLRAGRAGSAALARTVRTWRFRPASEFLAGAEEDELSNVLSALGGVRTSRRVAQRIVVARKTQSIETTDDLKSVVDSQSPALLAPVFQALRILVNDEYGAVVAGLQAGWSLLRPGDSSAGLRAGRLVVISFQGTEDRIVKEVTSRFPNVRKLPPIRPSADEIAGNLRARSAKLRTFEKLIIGN